MTSSCCQFVLFLPKYQDKDLKNLGIEGWEKIMNAGNQGQMKGMWSGQGCNI